MTVYTGQTRKSGPFRMMTDPEIANHPGVCYDAEMKFPGKDALQMIRRIVCVICALLLFSGACCQAETLSENSSLDFDLSFSLNADAFPAVLRSRIRGYTDLLDRIGLRGNIAWSVPNNSMDLNATLYFRDKPSVSFPFRLYGAAPRLFLTSPLINDEIIFLNMAGFLEFAVKAKNTLHLDMPYLAFLYPYATEYSFSALSKEWEETITPAAEGGTVTPEQFRQLAGQWSTELQDNQYLQIWISALADGSQAREAINAEFESLPSYYKKVTGDQPLSVTRDEQSETWRNAAGDTLFSRSRGEDGENLAFSLPASANGYVPSFSLTSSRAQQLLSFDLKASVLRDENALPQPASGQEEEYDTSEEYDTEEYSTEEYDTEEYDTSEYDMEEYDTSSGSSYSDEEYEADEDYSNYEYEDEDYVMDDEAEESYVHRNGNDAAKWPEALLNWHIFGSGLPLSLPSASSFSITVSLEGAAYPNYSFVLSGDTGEDGTVSLALSKPEKSQGVSGLIFRCNGTLTPAGDKEVPDYMSHPYKKLYSVFSSNEETLADFTGKVLPPLIRSVFAFVAEVPTSACQSFLDDLTDMGVLNLLLN